MLRTNKKQVGMWERNAETCGLEEVALSKRDYREGIHQRREFRGLNTIKSNLACVS